MADIFSPIPASSQIFTSKSRPPFGQHLSSRHNQLAHANTLPQPVKITQKRRHSDDSDDDMERGSQSPAPSPEKQPQQPQRAIAQARSRKLPLKKVRLDAEKQDGTKSVENGVDVADARVLLGTSRSLGLAIETLTLVCPPFTICYYAPPQQIYRFHHTQHWFKPSSIKNLPSPNSSFRLSRGLQQTQHVKLSLPRRRDYGILSRIALQPPRQTRRWAAIAPRPTAPPHRPDLPF